MFRSRIARWALLTFLDRHPVSVTTADIPGPPAPMYLAGARLLEVFPLLPLIGKVSLSEVSVPCHTPDSSTSPPSPTETPTPTSMFSRLAPALAGPGAT